MRSKNEAYNQIGRVPSKVGMRGRGSVRKPEMIVAIETVLQVFIENDKL